MPAVQKHELGQVLMLSLRDFQQRLDGDLESQGFPGIRHRHRAVFMHLARHGASRSVDLAAAACIRRQSMMKIVHELEELSLVSRRADPEDSRAKLVELTSKGELLIQQLTQSTEQVWQQYAGMIGERDLQQVTGALQTLLVKSEMTKVN